MAELWLHDGSAPRKAKELYFHDGTAVRKLKEAWYHDGTAPRKVYSGVGTPALSDHSYGSGEASSTATFGNDGRLQLFSTSGSTVITAEWLSSSPTTVSSAECGAYDIQFTYVSGPNTHSGNSGGGGADKSGAAYATWLNLATSRSISVSAYPGTISGTGFGTLVFSVAIRPAGGGATLASCQITLSCAI